MVENTWREASSYPLAESKHLWLAHLGVAVVIAAIAVVVAIFPASRLDVAAQSISTGLPDGNRARGVYAVDSGYALSGEAYSALGTQLSVAREVAAIAPQQPPLHQ